MGFFSFLFNKTASDWRRLADQGDLKAQCKLGTCYSTGDGVKEDQEEAVKWWRKAAEQGDAASQFFLGVCYANGQGAKEDLEEAVKWWRKAAEQGDAASQFFLGVCYHNGRGVEKNNAVAFMWLKKSAAKGEEEAKKYLATNPILFWSSSDEKKLVEMSLKGAEQGDAGAQFVFGLLCMTGDRITDEAHYWLQKAANQGNEDAKRFLAAKAQLLNEAQLAKQFDENRNASIRNPAQTVMDMPTTNTAGLSETPPSPKKKWITQVAGVAGTLAMIVLVRLFGLSIFIPLGVVALALWLGGKLPQSVKQTRFFQSCHPWPIKTLGNLIALIALCGVALSVWAASIGCFSLLFSDKATASLTPSTAKSDVVGTASKGGKTAPVFHDEPRPPRSAVFRDDFAPPEPPLPPELKNQFAPSTAKPVPIQTDPIQPVKKTPYPFANLPIFPLPSDDYIPPPPDKCIEGGVDFYNQGKYKDAVWLFYLGAIQGESVCKTKLGICYENGLGIPKDYETAYSFYILAWKAKEPGAQEHMDTLRAKMKLDEVGGAYEKMAQWEKDHPQK